MSKTSPKDELETARQLVEATIRELGINPTTTRVESEEGSFAYALRRGSARVLVALHPKVRNRAARLRIVAPVVKLSGSEAPKELYLRLLELNGSHLAGAAFAISNDEVIIVSERSVIDLDPSEVNHLIIYCGQTADRFDDQLASEFELTRSSDK